MARNDRRERRDPEARRNREADLEKEAPLEETQQEKERERSKPQDQLGNQAIQDMIAQPRGGPGDGGAGGGAMARRAATEREGLSYGGEDDDPVDQPLTLDDLLASWNPTSKKSEDRPAFLSAMPTDELPEEDAELAALAEADPPELAPTEVSAGLLQPSAPALLSSLLPWTRQAGRWLGGTALDAAWRWLLERPPGFLAPEGSLVPQRATVAALATLVLTDRRPALLQRSEEASFVGLCLELSAGGPWLVEAGRAAGDIGATMPSAVGIFQQLCPGEPPGPALQGEPKPAACDRLLRALLDLAPLEDVLQLLPSAPTSSPALDPDPLDQLIESFFPAKADPDGEASHLAVQAAERLAQSTARTRLITAGLAAAALQAGEAWLYGRPVQAAREILQRVDLTTQEVLNLLLEIARAGQRRTVPPRGLHNGLKRAARLLDQQRRDHWQALSRLAAGPLPFAWSPDREVESPQPLREALLDNAWETAEEHLLASVDPLARAAGPLLLAASRGIAPLTLAAPLEEAARLAREVRGPRSGEARALDLLAYWARCGDPTFPLDRLGLDQEQAWTIRHGTWLCSLALAGYWHTRDRSSLELPAKRLYRLGQAGPLTLVLRYAPPGEVLAEPDQAGRNPHTAQPSPE